MLYEVITSWTVPMSGFYVASYTHGAPGHSWQIVACTGMSIGEKGMVVASGGLLGGLLMAAIIV